MEPRRPVSKVAAGAQAPTAKRRAERSCFISPVDVSSHFSRRDPPLPYRSSGSAVYPFSANCGGSRSQVSYRRVRQVIDNVDLVPEERSVSKDEVTMRYNFPHPD